MLRLLIDNLSRIVLIVGALAITAMVLFPPWRYTILLPRADNIEFPAGYDFILWPPDPATAEYNGKANWPRVSVKMDTERLAIQILGAGLVCGLLALAVRKRGR